MVASPESIIAAIPTPVQADIRAVYAHDPNNWFRRPSMRLWRIAMTRVLLSRGFRVNSTEFVLLVQRSLNLS